MQLKTNLALKRNYGGYRSPSKIKYIVWHYTANDGDTDESNAKFFKSYRGVSAHYFVDDDSATISVPDTYVAWSVGGSRYKDYKQTGGAKYYRICNNSNSISIELTDTKRDGKVMASAETINNAIELTRMLMKKYNIPIGNVIRHFDVTGKPCPAYYTNDHTWNGIRGRIGNADSEEIDYSLVFNATFYANKYPDLKNAKITTADQLLNHFITYGMKEGRQAIATFNVLAYKNKYSDLRDEYEDNLPAYYIHYITHGKAEGRKAV